MRSDATLRRRRQWDVRRCASLARSLRPKHCCAGIANSRPASGLSSSAADRADRGRGRSLRRWSCGWRLKTPAGAKRGSAARCKQITRCQHLPMRFQKHRPAQALVARWRGLDPVIFQNLSNRSAAHGIWPILVCSTQWMDDCEIAIPDSRLRYSVLLGLPAAACPRWCRSDPTATAGTQSECVRGALGSQCY
jgi:hypothetical protein